MHEPKASPTGICLGLQIATIEFCRNVLGMTVQTPLNLKTIRSTLPSCSCLKSPRHTSVARCGWAVAQPCGNTTDRPSEACTGLVTQWMSDIDTATRSIRTSSNELRAQGWSLLARTNPVNGAKFRTERHPYYVGVQFHPEFKSRPGKPSPPFLGLLKAAANQLN